MDDKAHSYEEDDSQEIAREKDGEHIAYIKDMTKKLVENGKLDEVGFEPPGIMIGAIDSLDLMAYKEKQISDRLPLIALMDKVREIAYYLPIIK